MTLTVDLPPLLLDHFTQKAKQEGITPEAALVRFLEETVAEKTKRESAIAFFDNLLNEPSDDEGDPNYDVCEAIDANRGEGERKLFPPEMKGITW